MVRRSRALRRRYSRHRVPDRIWGHALGPQAISRPRGDGRYDVVVIDSHGTQLRTLARGVPYSLARSIIRRRHR